MEIKNIKNQQQEAFIQNLEKGFMVSNGVYADNFINRKLGRVGQPYKKGEEKEEPKLDKKIEKNLKNQVKGILNDDESLGIIRMEDEFHEGLKEAKEKYGFDKCYIIPIQIDKENSINFYAAKDKKGNISWFGGENELINNQVPIFDERRNFIKYTSGGKDLNGIKNDILHSIKYNNEVKKIHKKAKKGKWNPAPGPLAKKHNPFE